MSACVRAHTLTIAPNEGKCTRPIIYFNENDERAKKKEKKTQKQTQQTQSVHVVFVHDHNKGVGVSALVLPVDSNRQKIEFSYCKTYKRKKKNNIPSQQCKIHSFGHEDVLFRTDIITRYKLYANTVDFTD